VRRRRWRRWLLAAALLGLAAVAAMHEHVRWTADAYIVPASAAPRVDLIVVPGARIHPDGKPFHLLVDRLQTARLLWGQRVAPRILVSGRGGGGVAVDEVAAMRAFLQERGVPSAAIVDDGDGLRTIDTMRRCSQVFGARSAVVVTNPFHVARAVFLGRHSGLEVTGVAAPYGYDYSRSTMLSNRGREVAARVWAWLEVFVLS